MASTSVADYQVLSDGSFTLEDYDSQTLALEVPSDFVMESGVRQPIMAFKILPFNDDTAFKVYVNDREVISQTGMDKSLTRGWWESFSAKTAFPENVSHPKANSVKFQVTRGKAQFSDVVLWYQIKR